MTVERGFVAELKRRRVPHVALVYVASAFAAIRAADVIFPRMPLPAPGRGDDAPRAGRKEVELIPIEQEAWRGAARLDDMARIRLLPGAAAEATARLEDLLRRRAGTVTSPALLRLDPTRDGLRHRPRFQSLLRS